jgi:hypothetical protein
MANRKKPFLTPFDLLATGLSFQIHLVNAHREALLAVDRLESPQSNGLGDEGHFQSTNPISTLKSRDLN